MIILANLAKDGLIALCGRRKHGSALSQEAYAIVHRHHQPAQIVTVQRILLGLVSGEEGLSRQCRIDGPGTPWRIGRQVEVFFAKDSPRRRFDGLTGRSGPKHVRFDCIVAHALDLDQVPPHSLRIRIACMVKGDIGNQLVQVVTVFPCDEAYG